MASSRPVSMIIPPGVFEETNTNNILKEKSLKVPDRSSTSSLDSNSIQNRKLSKQNSLTQTTVTTTDSELESEQDDNPQTRHQKHDINSPEHKSRRKKHFYKLFKSEITDDMPDLIDSYVCAYQGDILLQGKMYITNRYLCFHSRIISYVTKHVYRWEDIKYVTKDRVAFIFPTAIGIQLKNTGKKVIYASFITRDQAFDKIHSIWSQYNDGTNSSSNYDEDEDEEVYIAQDGTLKAINNNEKVKYRKHGSYEVIDAPEHDEVLQMYLKKDKNPKNPRLSSISSKSSDDKQQVKQRSHSSNKRSTVKSSDFDQQLSNGLNENTSNTNQPVRRSRFSKNDQKQSDASKKNSSVVKHRSQSTSLKPRQSQSHSRDRNSSLAPQTLTDTDSIPNPVINTSSPTTDTVPTGLMTKILITSVSIIKLIIEYILSFFQHFKIYPFKTTIILLLFLTVLFFHSFYLIKLAYRIENRLQTLRHTWPQPSIKNSFPSSSKDL